MLFSYCYKIAVYRYWNGVKFIAVPQDNLVNCVIIIISQRSKTDIVKHYELKHFGSNQKSYCFEQSLKRTISTSLIVRSPKSHDKMKCMFR